MLIPVRGGPHVEIPKSFLRSSLSACSFLTTLPVPTSSLGADMRLPVTLPVVGAVLGALWAALAALLSLWGAPLVLRGAVMSVATLALTGGLHMDGLMDTCDALFSRRGREARLEILSDPRAGSFAVMGCVAVMMLKASSHAALLADPSWLDVLHIALVPVWSRVGMGMMLSWMPFARPGGLARAVGAGRGPGDMKILTVWCAALTGLSAATGAWALPVIWGLSLLWWQRRCVATFGGVTGDLLGAFAEASEALMLVALAA